MQVPLQRAGASTGWLCAAGALMLAGCASAPPRTGVYAPGRAGGVVAEAGRDGAEARPPAGLDKVPDAEPRLEPIRAGGPNKPYEALGREYVPITQDRAFSERGLASWYGRKFQGRRTASGEVYDMYAMTAAHPTLPIPSYARVRNPANGREVVVRVNDRGPFHGGRVIDLSYTAALRLDLLRGVAPVEVERITYEEIRAGTWRRGAPADALQVASRDVAAPIPWPAPTAPTAPIASIASITPIASIASIAPTASITPTASIPSIASITPTAPIASTVPVPVAVLVPVAAALPDRDGAGVVVPAASAEAPPIADAPGAQAFTLPARGFWIQLGAFRQRDGATAFQRRIAVELEWLSPLLAVFSEASLFRLQAGPYPSREDARGAAESIRTALQLVPVIVQRR